MQKKSSLIPKVTFALACVLTLITSCWHSDIEEVVIEGDMISVIPAPEVISEKLHSLSGESADYDALIEFINDAGYVLLGESTHGTHEFYKTRAEITKRLIEEKGFNVVAIEAEWIASDRIDRFIHGIKEMTAEEALGGFKNYPSWVWRNKEIVDLITWLRNYNSLLPEDDLKIMVYGFDIYNAFDSIEMVISLLEKIDPQEAQRARMRYSCFDAFERDFHRYGETAASDPGSSCEAFVGEELADIIRAYNATQKAGNNFLKNTLFQAVVNAIVAKGAEGYFRMLYGEGDDSFDSWNVRDYYMIESLTALIEHYKGLGADARIVLWAHNSHIGDIRATESSQAGQINLGRLFRERFGEEVVLVGFFTNTGSVLASTGWDSQAENMELLPVLEESHESLFHQIHVPSFYLTFNDDPEHASVFREERLHRSIGVIYVPANEREKHYTLTKMADQFDAVFYFDRTTPVRPLDTITN